MPVPILQTKLYIPISVRENVPRSRLSNLLDDGLRSAHRLILVSAPAGFGKTTLLCEWIAKGDFQTAWLSLDEHENDPIRFLSYFLAAWQKIDPTLGEDILSMLSSPQPPPLDIALTELLNQLIDLSNQTILVLDDYHRIENQDIHAAITFFIENLPPQVHVVILSRADPPMPLARLRARGQLTELRAQDLRFRIEEIRPFLKRNMQLDLSDDQIQSLEFRTEGWIAGIQMAALSLKDKTEIDEFLSTFSGSHRFILDYLTDEVLQSQPKEIQDFILQTAILDRMNASLSEAVTDQVGGQETLEKLEETNLFLLPLDDERQWFRYHHLFADVMVNRLHRFYPDQIPDLHLRAARWFQESDLFAEAIEHAFAANNYTYAAALVESQALDLLKTGDLSTLSGWLNQFPPQIVSERPALGVASAWMYVLIGKQEYVENYLVTAEKKLNTLDDPDELRGQIAAIRTYIAARLEKPDQAIQLAHQALELLSKENLAIRCVVAFVLGGAYYMRLDFPKALEAMQEAGDLGEKAGNLHLAVSALSSKADVLLSQGKFAESEKTYLHALQLGTGQSGKPLPYTASVYSGLARLHLEKNDLISARRFAQTGLELGGKWVNPDSQVSCCLTIAKIESIEGDFSEAHRALEQAKHLAAGRDLFPGLEARISEYEAAIMSAPSSKPDQASLPDPLTERELEVLQLLAAGMSNRAIANELVIALGTTKTHISRIMGKLNAENRTQAVILARELGLIP